MEGVPESRNERSGRRFRSSSWSRNNTDRGGNKNHNTSDNNKPSGSGTSNKKPSGDGNSKNNNHRSGGNGGRPNGNGNSSSNRGNTSTQDDRAMPKLSDKERNELLASGKCFRCKEAGHLSRNCPRGNSVQSGRPNRPPGLASNSIGVNFVEVNRLRDLAETTESVDDIQVGMVSHDIELDLPLRWDIDPSVS